jgi:zinc transport system substrate-binding protein
MHFAYFIRVISVIRVQSCNWRFMMKNIFVFCLLSFVLFAACQKDEQSVKQEETKKNSVASVNYPLYYFAQRIGGDQIEALLPVSPEGDPAYWKPTEAGISLFQKADLILLNGAGYAKWIEKVSLPTSKMHNTSESFKKYYIELHEGITHSHGPEGDHVHKGYAFTTWLNLKFAIEQAAAVTTKLVQILPEQKEYFEMNFQELKTDLEILDDELMKISQNLQNHNLFGSHPVYQYLASGYGLTIRSEHWEPGQKISKEQWKAFQDKLKSHPGKIMLWEGPPLSEVKNQLMGAGVTPVVYNPCGNQPESGDFVSVMKSNIENLKAAM